jgi:hypothetical protein
MGKSDVDEMEAIDKKMTRLLADMVTSLQGVSLLEQSAMYADMKAGDKAILAQLEQLQGKSIASDPEGLKALAGLLQTSEDVVKTVVSQRMDVLSAQVKALSNQGAFAQLTNESVREMWKLYCGQSDRCVVSTIVGAITRYLASHVDSALITDSLWSEDAQNKFSASLDRDNDATVRSRLHKRSFLCYLQLFIHCIVSMTDKHFGVECVDGEPEAVVC